MPTPDPLTAVTSTPLDAMPADATIATLLEGVTEAVCVLDRGWRFVYLNAAAEALLGRSRGGLLDTSIWDAFPTSAFASADTVYRRALAAGEVVSFESAYPEHDRWLEVRVYPSAAGYTVYLGDISARKRAEAALREREARLRTQYQAFPLPTYTWEHRDGEFIFTDYNAATDTFARGSLAAHLGRTAAQIYAAMPEVTAHLARCLAERATLRHELCYAGADLLLTYIWAETNLVVLHSEDQTERKAAEAALRASEGRYRALVRHARDVTLIIGPDGNMRYVSPAVERVLGYRVDEVGANAFAWVHPDDLPAAQAAFVGLIAQPQTTRIQELRVRHKDGTWHWVEATATNLLDDPDIGGLVIHYNDITARKGAEAALRASEANLAEAQRIAQLGNWEYDFALGELRWSDEVFRIGGMPRNRSCPPPTA